MYEKEEKSVDSQEQKQRRYSVNVLFDKKQSQYQQSGNNNNSSPEELAVRHLTSMIMNHWH